MQILLDFDEQLLKKYEHRGASLIFNITWEHDGVYYPSKNWIDFGVVVIGWWIGVINQLGQESNKSEFLFMDGPYSIEIKFDKKQGVVTLVPKGLDVVWIVSFSQLVGELISAAKRIYEEFNRIGVGKTDQISLQKGIKLLQQHVRD